MGVGRDKGVGNGRRLRGKGRGKKRIVGKGRGVRKGWGGGRMGDEEKGREDEDKGGGRR